MPQSVLLHCIIDIKHCHLPIAVKIAGIEDGRAARQAPAPASSWRLCFVLFPQLTDAYQLILTAGPLLLAGSKLLVNHENGNHFLENPGLA